MSWIGQKVKNLTNSEKLRRKKLKDDSVEVSAEQPQPAHLSPPPTPPLAGVTTTTCTTTTNTTNTTTSSVSPVGPQRQVFMQSDMSTTRNPLDWGNMPSALRQHFPHWKDQAFSSPDVARKTSAPATGDRATVASPITRYSKLQEMAPENTIPYIVMVVDTLNSIALKFDTTPAEIARINKKALASFQIIPGQLLFVPDCSPTLFEPGKVKKKEEEIEEDETPHSAPPCLKNFDSPFPNVEHGVEETEEDEMCDDYIRMTAKFITEYEGCVGGNLLFNSQSLMFRPDPTSPLVQERGVDVFEILLPLGNIVHAVVSSNCSFPHITVSDKKTESKDLSIVHSSPPYAPPTTIKDTRQTRKDQRDEEEEEEKEEEEEGRSENETELVGNEDVTRSNDVKNLVSKDDDFTHQAADPQLDTSTATTTESNTSWELSPSQPKPGTREDSNPSSEDLLAEMEPTAETSGESSPYMSPVEQKDEEEEESDKRSKQLTDSLTSCQFLHVRVSQTIQQEAPIIGIAIPVGPNKGRERHDSVSLVRTWFCFAVPEKRVGAVKDFLLSHHPAVEQGTNITHHEKSINGSFEVINVGGNFNEDALTISESHFRSSWEVFSVRDFEPTKIERMEVEHSLPLPVLSEPSNLLEEAHIRKLTPNLISPAVGHDWCLIYSTFQHGISLHTLYRKMVDFEDTPVLLLVREQSGNLFGVMISCTLRICERFYGTGESFMFSFSDDGSISVYQWTGTNDYIVKGSPDSIAFGSGDGHFGLWLDEDFYRGCSMPCSTFDNKCLSSKEDFICEGVEAWGFR